MALVKCPACQHDVSDQAPTCPNCGHPRAGGGRPAGGFGMPAALQPQSAARSRFQPDRRAGASLPLPGGTCPRCGGRGKIRDKNLLPWNNMGVFALVLGVAGFVGSAYLDLDFRALLILGVALAGLGVGLYVTGETCPICDGAKRRGAPRKKGENRGGSQPVAVLPPAEVREVRSTEPSSPPAQRSASPSRPSQRTTRTTGTRRRTDRRARAEQDRH